MITGRERLGAISIDTSDDTAIVHAQATHALHLLRRFLARTAIRILGIRMVRVGDPQTRNPGQVIRKRGAVRESDLGVDAITST